MKKALIPSHGFSKLSKFFPISVMDERTNQGRWWQDKIPKPKVPKYPRLK